MTDTIVILDELPEKPTGWKKHMTMHLRLQGGGTGCFSIHDEKGRKVEGIGYSYRKGGKEFGFFLLAAPGDEYLTWAQLRVAYAAARAAVREPAQLLAICVDCSEPVAEAGTQCPGCAASDAAGEGDV